MSAPELTAYEEQLLRKLQDPDRLRALDEEWARLDDGRWHERCRTLARLAAQMLSAELAEVNLVSATTMHCVASASDDERDVPVEASYCQHVVGTAEAVLVYDSLLDPLVRDSVTATSLRAYLGIPLSRDGHVFGALCVAQAGPRAWTEVDLALLTELAAELLDEPEG